MWSKIIIRVDFTYYLGTPNCYSDKFVQLQKRPLEQFPYLLRSLSNVQNVSEYTFFLRFTVFVIC